MVNIKKDISEAERLVGWMRLQKLFEVIDEGNVPVPEGGVSSVEIGAAYLGKEKIMQEVQKRIIEMAPHGVQSQGEYIEILEKALNGVVDDFKKQEGNNLDLLADIDLTISMIERTLRQIPFQVFFGAMGKQHQQDE